MEIKRYFLKNPSYTKQTRQNLRNNPTAEEAILWEQLKGKELDGIKFRRQYGIGPYVVDFYSPKLNLVIEIDGLIHLKPDVKNYDDNRTKYLTDQGFIIIRFTNDEINNKIEEVLNKIKSFL